ncbi:MAG: VCBS repeat-containing protein [Bacteroidetes bacterium]|nr:VCBS repeat-containing protein [Bacteroidota bacterium]
MIKRYVLPILFMLLFVAGARAQDTTWFSDATAKAGLAGAKGFRINIVDIDNDDYPDLLLENGLSTREKLTKIYLNRQNPASTNPRDRIFVDVTDSSGIFANPDGDTSRVIDIATMADVNNDGNVDLVTGTYFDRLENFAFPNDRCEVMLGDGAGHFTLVPHNGLHELGLINTAGFTFLDYNLDGKLDLYVTTWFADKTNDIYAINYLMRGNGDGTFTDETEKAGMGDEDWPEYGASSTDWNNDGLPDIFTSAYCRNGGNLWRNNGDGTFTDMAQAMNYSSQHTTGDVDASGPRALCQWAAQPADYDNDGDMDIAQVLVHGGLDAGEGRTSIAVNKGAGSGFAFDWDPTRLPREVPRSAHLGDQDGWWFDMDNDGLQDFTVAQCVYLPETDRSYLWRQNPDHTFGEVTKKVGLLWLKETHNMRPFDYDLDGDEDLLVELWRKNGVVVSDIALVENHIGERNNWCAVKLVAPSGVNRNAIGARIMVYSGGVTQIREVQAGQGHFGAQAPLIKSFGLAKNAAIDSIVVLWPSRPRRSTAVTHPPINALLAIGADGLIPSSVPGTAAAAGFAVTPNPASDRLRVSLPAAWPGGVVELYDALGTRLQRIDAGRGIAELGIDISGAAAGYYVVRAVPADAGGEMRTMEQGVVKR